MAFPTGQGKMSGVKSDTRDKTYEYRTGVQPNGTPSIGNWNTGGSFAGVGNQKGVYAPDGTRVGGSVPPSSRGRDPLAALFAGGKGGPTGTIGAVNPALRTRRPFLPGEVPVALPPAEYVQELERLNRPLTPQEQAMVDSWRKYGGNAFRWPTAARNPTAPSNPGYHTGFGPPQLPGSPYPNPQGGYNPGALVGGNIDQEVQKNGGPSPKYQQRVNDRVAGMVGVGGWGGAR